MSAQRRRRGLPGRLGVRVWTLCFGASLVAATLATPERADAGWRELGFVFVSMDTSGAADARSCYTKLRSAVTGREGEDLVHVRLGRETLQRKLGDATTANWRSAEREAFKALVDWEPKTWRGPDGKVIKGAYTVDAWVLVDCQPATQTLDVVTVAPVTGSVMRLHLGNREITNAARAYATSFIVAHAWADWSP